MLLKEENLFWCHGFGKSTFFRSDLSNILIWDYLRSNKRYCKWGFEFALPHGHKNDFLTIGVILMLMINALAFEKNWAIEING